MSGTDRAGLSTYVNLEKHCEVMLLALASGHTPEIIGHAEASFSESRTLRIGGTV